MIQPNRRLSIPLISPRNENSLVKLLDHVIRDGNGTDLPFIYGMTGEFYAVPTDERKAHTEIAAEHVTSRRKEGGYLHNLELAVGVNGKDLDETVELAQNAEESGATYAVLHPILLNTKRGGTEHTRRGVTGIVERVLSETSNIRIIVYNNPHISFISNANGLDKSVRTETWKKLAQNGRVYGIKDSSGDEKRTRNYLEAADKNAKVYVGDEVAGLELLNAHGIVAGGGNILPAAWAMATVLDQDNDNDLQYKVGEKLKEFSRVYAENPIGVFNHLLIMKGVIKSEPPRDNRNRTTQKQVEAAMGLFYDRDFQVMYDWGRK